MLILFLDKKNWHYKQWSEYKVVQVNDAFLVLQRFWLVVLLYLQLHPVRLIV
jgi:hypothetical protein